MCSTPAAATRGYGVTYPKPIANPSEPTGNNPGPVDRIERAGAYQSEETWLTAELLGAVTLALADSKEE
jgi:hypothetical protein